MLKLIHIYKIILKKKKIREGHCPPSTRVVPPLISTTINIHSPIHLEGECKGFEKKFNKDKEDRSGVKKKKLKNKEEDKEKKAKLQSTEEKAEE